MGTGTVAADAEALIPQFQLSRVLNQGTKSPISISSPQLTASDQAGRRTALLGTIDSKQCLLVLERAPFSGSPAHLATIPSTLRSLKNLGANDIYFWFMACSGSAAAAGDQSPDLHEDLKINLIYPCTEKHVKKYSRQGARMVTETAEIYREKVRPYMQRQREEGRLNWVWNIVDGKTEVEDVIYRTAKGVDVEGGFLLLPDLNWDRKTMDSLHLLGLVERMDIWSLRDLKKKHIPWLKEMKAKILEATVKTYPELEEDQLKLYVHYQPTYYHFHIHIVHVALEAGATQAVGKAVGLDSIISQLHSMGGDSESGMEQVDLTYGLGEASELWTEVFEPLKKRGTTSQSREPNH
jgi:m7GpppX diphosphatase